MEVFNLIFTLVNTLILIFISNFLVRMADSLKLRREMRIQKKLREEEEKIEKSGLIDVDEYKRERRKI